MPRKKPSTVQGVTYDALTGEEIYVEDYAPSGIGYGELLDAQNQPYYGDLPLADDWSGGTSASLMDRFREAANRFENAYFQFSALGVPPGDPLYTEYVRIGEWANQVRATMESIAGGISGGVDAAKSAFGLSAVRGTVKGLGKLGVVPLLGVAAIGGAVAVLVAATNSMLQFIVNWQRVDAGKKPVPTAGLGIGETLDAGSSLVKWIVFGAVVYFAAPEILKRLPK